MKMFQSKIVTAGDMSGVINSKVVDLAEINLGSIQAVYAGAPTGQMKLQLSNDMISDSVDPNGAVTNWSDYSGSQVNITAAGNYIYNISNMGYRWCRLVYTPSAGNGTLDATLGGKNA